ncbi:SMI1/KNR4 family protein [Burkholderia glumae]|nr:SMI1/KNR4 family protein [Burkholderia glumae]
MGTSQDAIRAAEAQLGRALPRSFAEWLLANNGRALGALSVFPVYDARDPRKTWESIVRRYQSDWQEWQEVAPRAQPDPDNLLPFAEFGTGDYYCSDYGRPGAAGEPKVVLWSHETGSVTEKADNFSDFFEHTGTARLTAACGQPRTQSRSN